MASEETKVEPAKEEAKEKVNDPLEQLVENIKTLLRGIELDDKNLFRRVWRKNTFVRKNISTRDLQQAILFYMPKGGNRERLLVLFEQLSNVEKERKSSTSKVLDGKKVAEDEPMMEIEAYLSLLVASLALGAQAYETAIEVCIHMIQRLNNVNRQSLDSFVAKAYSYLSLACERILRKNNTDVFKVSGTEISTTWLISELMHGHRTASLRLYEESKAALTNLILRKYILEKRYQQADMFKISAGFPANSSSVGNNEQVRYNFYVAKITAIFADYSKSDECSTMALRKAPQFTALGFRIAVNKLNIVTKLLMGELPDRAVFSVASLQEELKPYLDLVRAVRNGSIMEFQNVLAENEKAFDEDDLLTLIERLRSSVIKAALRNISMSYSKISFDDIKTRLGLPGANDAELLCAKAIRDQIISNATIDADSGCLISTEVVDIYSTTLNPKSQFSQRADFCINVHNSAVRALKYPPNSHKVQSHTNDKIREEFGEFDML